MSNDKYSKGAPKGPNANNFIKADPVRLIDQNGEMIGVVPLRQALNMAQDVGLDLVEVSPNAEPPVCKILDIGKFLYEEQKKKKEAKKKQRIVQTKEIKLRFNTDSHDLEYRLKNARTFISEGDKVKFSIKFRGREVTHSEISEARMKGIIEHLSDIARVDSSMRMEQGQLVMTLAPLAVVVK